MDEIAERNNINPAFTPNCNFYFDFIFLPNIYFGFGNDNFIIRDFIYNKDGQTTTFLSSDEAIANFYNGLKPTTTIDANLNLNILSFGFKVKKHYFTFDFGAQANVAAYIPKDIFKFALYGTPDANGINSFNFNQLGVDASIYSNIGLGYMYEVNRKLTIGTKIKFLMGYANINTNINKLNLNASRQEWSLETDGKINASLPITFNTMEDGSIDFNSIQINNKNDLLSLLYKPAGIGAAIDLGIKYEPIKNLTLSASITDLGFIHWNRNTLSANMQGNHLINQLIDYNVGDTFQISAITDQLTNLGNEILGTVRTNGENKAYTTMIYANFFVGAEYGILKNRISFGAVNRLKFKNTHIQDELTLAVNFRPLHWLKASFSHSFINGRFGTLGAGLNLRAGMMNMYFIADYIPTSYAQIPLENEPISKVLVPNRAQRFNLQMGWSWNLGRHANDPDRDGIKRLKDKCPETDMDFLRKQCPGLKKKQYVDKHGCELDDDKDGVHNCFDKCPETPVGVIVDSVGCPIDSDNDGIADYIDLCPNTPKKVSVNEQGCPIDSDSDGVADYIDLCPETPNNILVDSIGCPIDSDNDGVANHIDLCPETPMNVQVDSNGCPIDSDNDGVANYIDLCPETPMNVQVDSNGCPLDSDNDGILDNEDKCPNKPGPINNYGCPELKKEIKNLFTKAMSGIQFESGRDIIKEISFPILDQIVAILELNPEYHLTISGHTDNDGDEDKNMNLSISRAAAVAKYIENKGIAAERLTSQGFGENRPIADNKTTKGRAKNRRVEFEISYETITYEKVINPELQNITTPSNNNNDK
jgi:outer membrane protein OmpA-like peptidoglycan-associated protein